MEDLGHPRLACAVDTLGQQRRRPTCDPKESVVQRMKGRDETLEDVMLGEPSCSQHELCRRRGIREGEVEISSCP